MSKEAFHHVLPGSRCWLLSLTFLFFLATLLTSENSSGQVVINEILAKNSLFDFDEDGSNQDWVEMHNRGAVEVNLAGYCLTDNPELPFRWLFPDIRIPANGFLRIWLSGKDRFVPPPEAIVGNAGNFAFRADIIQAQEEWQYLVADPQQSGPPPGWNQIGFDAAGAGFSTGLSGFGYGDDDDFTMVPTGTNAVFIRKTFTVPDPRQLFNLILQVDFDDGFVAYLNGTRVASENFGTSDPTFASFSTGSHEHGTPQRYDLTPYLDRLESGENVLALVGLNVGATSSDLSLTPELGTVPLVLHANFQIDADGEYLGFSDPSGIPLDWKIIPPQTDDHSYGRSPDGTGEWYYLLTPTPEKPNETVTFNEPFSSEVEIDPPSGKYRYSLLDPVMVTISAQPEEITEIRYTTNGSVPTAGSALFSDPIRITQNTVIRAAGFVQGERSTRILSKSYIIGGNLQLPILSISMEPADYEKVHNDSWASGRGSERPAYLEIFESDGTPGPATGFGLRLHGGAGRNGDFETKKAYKCYFRKIYGKGMLHYPIIPETPVASFDKLVLRSGFNDAFRTNGRAAYIRDELIRDLHEDMGALVSNGSWYNVFVNMKYRGIFNVVERMDRRFLNSYTGTDNWDVIKTGNDVLDGDRTEWNRLHDFMLQNDLSREDIYTEAKKLLDIENFTSYMILNTWAQNHDWPHNNWYAARERIPEGKWIFLSWDAEFGIGLIPQGYSEDTVQFAIDKGGYISDIFESLLKNSHYQAYFMEEVDRHLFFALNPKNVLPRIDQLRAAIASDIPEETAVSGGSYSQWLQNIDTTRTFASQRGTVFRNFLENSTQYNFPAPPRIFQCDQQQVVNTGEVAVRFRGTRFNSNTRFTFNGLSATSTRLISSGLESIMNVTLPLHLTVSRFPVVAVTDPLSGQYSEASDLLEVLPPVPELLHLDPPQGNPEGGETVRISGNYFLKDLEVHFGDVPATGVVLTDDDPPAIEVVTPPGQGEVEVLVTNVIPGGNLPAANSLLFTYNPSEPRFHRGDASGDGSLDISDPIRILGFLFLGSEEPECMDAADTDDSGQLDLNDAVFNLKFQFQGGADMPPPHPDCGEDPTLEQLGCENPGACAEE